MVTTVSSRDAVIACIGRSDFSIMAARRNSLFLTSAGPLRSESASFVILFATISVAIVMVVLGSGIASAGASHVVARLGISDGPHDREDRRLTRPVNYAWRILGLSMTLTGRSYVPLSRIDGHRQD